MRPDCSNFPSQSHSACRALRSRQSTCLPLHAPPAQFLLQPAPGAPPSPLYWDPLPPELRTPDVNSWRGGRRAHPGTQPCPSTVAELRSSSGDGLTRGWPADGRRQRPCRAPGFSVSACPALQSVLPPDSLQDAVKCRSQGAPERDSECLSTLTSDPSPDTAKHPYF